MATWTEGGEAGLGDASLTTRTNRSGGVTGTRSRAPPSVSFMGSKVVETCPGGCSVELYSYLLAIVFSLNV
jgi:hypothetical protein